MTPAEKAGQLTQYFYFPCRETPTAGPALGLDATHQPRMVEAALARGEAGSLLFVTDPAEINRLQRLAVEGNRLGIPALFGFDVIHGLRTILPVPIAMAASWDPETIERGQAVAAREARAVGIHWTFAPMVDIARDPRWGRIIEGAGEDPFLGAAVAAAQVRGFQGERLGTPERVIAGPKHFAGYGAALGGRDYDEVNLSDSELWNVYFPPFEAALEAGAGNVMTAYMDLNGIPATGNRWLFTDVLRGDWGFEGFVVSDANAVRNLVTHGFAARPDRRRGAGGERRHRHGDGDRRPGLRAPARGGRARRGERGDARRERAARARGQAAAGPVRRAVRRRGARARGARRPRAPRGGARSPPSARRCCCATRAGCCRSTRRVGSIAVIGPLADSRRDTLGPWVLRLRPRRDRDGARRASGAGWAASASTTRRASARRSATFPSMFDMFGDNAPEDPEDFDDEAELRARGRRSPARPTSRSSSSASGRT